MGGRAQRAGDPFRDPFDIPEHLVIPKPQHVKALGFQPGRARGVPVLLARVLAAVDLDHELFRQAREVHHIRADGCLEIGRASCRERV